MNVTVGVTISDSEYVLDGLWYNDIKIFQADLLGHIASDILSATSFTGAQARALEIAAQADIKTQEAIAALNSVMYSVMKYNWFVSSSSRAYWNLLMRVSFWDGVFETFGHLMPYFDTVIGLSLRCEAAGIAGRASKEQLILWSQVPNRTGINFFIETSGLHNVILSPIVTINPVTIKSEVASDYVYESGSILSKIFLPPVIYTTAPDKRVIVEKPSMMPWLIAAGVAYFALK
jgi:hypothetical protein